MATSINPYLLVAAIDYGTTYSGYAFSFQHDYKKDPCKISTKLWNSRLSSLASLKAATCALFDPNRIFHSFGYKAEKKYADLAEDGEAPDWYYFRRFKMTLYNKMTLKKKNFDLEADDGKTLPAMTVFSACLKNLVDHLFKTCEDRICGVERTDIRLVLTVPAIWNDAVKQFMREAAEKDSVAFPVYASTENDPAYVTDESCTHLGTLNIDLKETVGTDRPIFVQIYISGT